MSAPRDLRWGAECLADGHTRFCLWAPDCAHVWLDLKGRAPVPMQPLPGGGFFETTAPAGGGTLYRYRLETADGPAVPDPASRAQEADVEGYSRVVDPRAYRWRCANWHGRPWHETVLYEAHVGVLGGFDAMRARLDEWIDLGITAIELMPVNAFSGERNWGYDGVLLWAPATPYGTPDQLKALVDAAHDRGLMMLLDVVYNHFGPSGNFLPRYASAFFREDRHTPWGPAIDFRRPEVRDFVVDNALYWLNEFRFDGLRVDATHAIEPQSFLVEFAARVRQGTSPDRHIHLIAEHEGNAAHLLGNSFDAQWNDDFHHAVHVLLTGERESYYRDYQEHPEQLLARALAEGFAYQGEVSKHSGRARGEPSAHLPPTCFVDFLQNHDQVGNRAMGERLQSLVAPAAVEAALVLLLMAPQIPMLFMGEEFASTHPFPYFTDYTGDLADAVREGRRREFAGFSAFADDAARARIPDPSAAETFALARSTEAERNGESARRRKILIRHLLELRRREVIPWLPRARAASCVCLGIKSFCLRWPRQDAPTLVVAVNLGAQQAPITSLRLQVLFETTPGTAACVVDGTLPAFSAVVGTDA